MSPDQKEVVDLIDQLRHLQHDYSLDSIAGRLVANFLRECQQKRRGLAVGARREAEAQRVAQAAEVSVAGAWLEAAVDYLDRAENFAAAARGHERQAEDFRAAERKARSNL